MQVPGTRLAAHPLPLYLVHCRRFPFVLCPLQQLSDLLQADLVQQCRAVGLPHSKKNKEDLATSLLAAMQSEAFTSTQSDQSSAASTSVSHDLEQLLATTKVHSCNS